MLYDAFKKMLLNEIGKLSWMKIGVWLVTGTAALYTAGQIPENLIWLAKDIAILGAAFGLVGYRDAMKK